MKQTFALLFIRSLSILFLRMVPVENQGGASLGQLMDVVSFAARGVESASKARHIHPRGESSERSHIERVLKNCVFFKRELAHFLSQRVAFSS